MALQKTATDARGNTGNYWPILELGLLPRQGAAKVHIVMFKDAATAAANKNGDANTAAMAGHRIALTGTDFDDLLAAALDPVNKNPYAVAYEKIKLLTTPVDFTTGTEDV